jgi:hypothetical protein
MDTSLGLLAAVAFGLPAISNSVELLVQASPEGIIGRVLQPVRDFAIADQNLALALYAVLLVIAVAFVGLAVRWSTDLKISRTAPRRVGIAWKPGEYRVTLVQNRYRGGYAEPKIEQREESVPD